MGGGRVSGLGWVGRDSLFLGEGWEVIGLMGIEVRVKGVTGGERDCIIFCGVLFLYICMSPLCGVMSEGWLGRDGEGRIEGE